MAGATHGGAGTDGNPGDTIRARSRGGWDSQKGLRTRGDFEARRSSNAMGSEPSSSGWRLLPGVQA